MDLLGEYIDLLTKDYVGAEVLGKKIRVRTMDGGICVHDVDGLLEDYKREYVYLCIIREGDERGTVETYDGKLYKRGTSLYFVDTTQPDPSRKKEFKVVLDSGKLVTTASGELPREWAFTASDTTRCSSYDVVQWTSCMNNNASAGRTDHTHFNARILDTTEPSRNMNVYAEPLIETLTISDEEIQRITDVVMNSIRRSVDGPIG